MLAEPATGWLRDRSSGISTQSAWSTSTTCACYVIC